MKDGKVYVIDDDKGARDALSWLLKQHRYTVHTYGSAREFLRQYVDNEPTVLLVDVKMPDIDGIQLLEIAHDEGWLAPVVMLSGLATVSIAMQAVKLGAFDFLEKPIVGQQVQETLDKALDAAMALRHAADKAQQREGTLSALTGRERQVFERLILGETNKMISRTLAIAERTVEAHRAKVMEKTGATNLADLIKLRA